MSNLRASIMTATWRTLFTRMQKHLRITSFPYGLLRPPDLISPYRLEGSVRLDGMDIFSRWRPILTDMFISEIQGNGFQYDAARCDRGRLVFVKT